MILKSTYILKLTTHVETRLTKGVTKNQIYPQVNNTPVTEVFTALLIDHSSKKDPPVEKNSAAIWKSQDSDSFKISLRYFSEIFKRATFKSACEKNSVVESVFSKTAVTDSRPATLFKASFQ